MNKFGRKTSVVDNLFFLRNSLAYGRQIYFYRLKLIKLWFDCENLWFVVEYVWIQEVETMDYERIKRNANDILEDLSSECSYIEYKEAVVLKLT